jgi:hypothetical protein
VSQQNIFRKQSNDSSSSLQAGYCVVHLLAKENKPFSNGEFVRKCLLHTEQDIHPEK